MHMAKCQAVHQRGVNGVEKPKMTQLFPGCHRHPLPNHLETRLDGLKVHQVAIQRALTDMTSRPTQVQTREDKRKATMVCLPPSSKTIMTAIKNQVYLGSLAMTRDQRIVTCQMTSIG